MECRLIGVRKTIPSGEVSYKVTLPSIIIKENWGKSDDDIKEGFMVCFLEKNGKIIIEPLQAVLKSDEYPDELRKKVRDDAFRYKKRDLLKKCESLWVKLVYGKINQWKFDEEFNRLKGEFKRSAILFKNAFNERELHFIASGDIDQLIALASIEEEEEKENEFRLIIDDIKKIYDELDFLNGILEQLEKAFSEGRVKKKLYEIIKERYAGKLESVKRRVNELKSFVCKNS